MISNCIFFLPCSRIAHLSPLSFVLVSRFPILLRLSSVHQRIVPRILYPVESHTRRKSTFLSYKYHIFSNISCHLNPNICMFISKSCMNPYLHPIFQDQASPSKNSGHPAASQRPNQSIDILLCNLKKLDSVSDPCLI